jgi:hypothetical protein
MNSASFNTKVQVLKPNVDCKNRFMGMDERFCSFGVILATWMK